MRLNRYIANASGLSRRQADKLIDSGRVYVDDQPAVTGQDIKDNQTVTLDDKQLVLPKNTTTIILNKPTGYVVSRKGQGSKTVYDLLPKAYKRLKPIGRLDKDSSGLLLLSDNGELIQKLAHPKFNKQKVYEITLNKDLEKSDQDLINKGVQLNDGLSKLTIQNATGKQLIVFMSEGRNRQIRRTFDALDYKVIKLNRQSFGEFGLGKLGLGEYKEVNTD